MHRKMPRWIAAGLLCAGITSAAQGASAQSIPVFAPDDSTSWFPDRPQGDDYLPPPGGGPGPVLSDPAHPYVTNDEGRNTDCLMALLKSDKDISIRVLAASTAKEGPGPLVAMVAGTSQYPIPVTIVPGNLTDSDIDLLA